MKSAIRYRTKPESADENRALVEKVYEGSPTEIREACATPPCAWRMGSPSFHILMTDSEQAPNPLNNSEAFSEFQRDLANRCVEQPVAMTATVVGSYRPLNV